MHGKEVCVLFRETQVCLALRDLVGGTEGSWGARSDLPALQGLGARCANPGGATRWEGLDPFLPGEVRAHSKCGRLMNLENKVASTICIVPSFLS